MVYVTSGIRWSLGLWCACALGLSVVSVTAGAPLVWTGVLLTLLAIPPVVLAALTRFGSEGRTSSQVLYDKTEERR